MKTYLSFVSRISCFSLILLSAISARAVEPLYHFPLDGTADAAGTPGTKDSGRAVVYGRPAWTQGVIGRGLDVRRHAYDQVTCLKADALQNLPARAGTVAFWFKPHWSETDAEGRWLFSGAVPDWKPFRFYFIKNKSGTIELSVAMPKQVQIIKKNLFRKETWAHVAFSWDAPSGTVVLYIDGKEVARKTNPAAFSWPDPSVTLKVACGQASTDRFKANVGDGVYDDIRFYGTALTAQDVFLLASGGSSETMTAVTVPGADFAFTFKTARPTAARPLFRLFGQDASSRLTVSAMGSSGTLALIAEHNGQASTLESADTFRLDRPIRVSFRTDGARLEWLLDDAPQGRLTFSETGFPFLRAERIDGITFLPAKESLTPDGQHRLSDASVKSGENALWDLTDAARQTDGVRSGVTLNGYWRVMPVDDFTPAPPKGMWGYSRIPGSFRSPLWHIHRMKNEQLDAGSEQYCGRSQTSYRAAWYQRTFSSPIVPAGERVWLNFKNLNGDTGRVFLNGKQILSFRQDFKTFTVVPNNRRLDITDTLRHGETNLLTVYIDRHFIGLWRGVPAIGDHGEIALGDVWLESAPGKTALAAAVALPSFRQKNVRFRVRLDNPSGRTGAAELRAAFLRNGKTVKTFTRALSLDGSPAPHEVWSAPWPDPIVWTAENPELYDLRFSLIQDGRIADSLPVKAFGFREVWVENGEFKMNGVHLRLRMWTSPGLNRIRYYYGHPDAVAQYVAHVKEMNYDTVRFDPFGKTSQVGWTAYLDECDRQGLYNLFPMPPYEDEEIRGYTDEIIRFLEQYGTHPSILMWYTDFNTCGYSWDQDPAKLNDTDYDPPEKEHARARARRAEKIMRALDPGRELFQHAGGNSGRIFTSMNYQSFGTPLQEQEDWPRLWAARHTQPLMVVESAFPYPMQFWHFDDTSVGTLGAEHAARYFGDAAYGHERFPIPHSSPWLTQPEKPADDNMLRLSDLMYRRVVKAWRAYGVSAVGDFPGRRDMAHTARTFDQHNTVWSRSNEVKTPGLKPDNPEGWSEVQRHLLTDYSLPDYQHNTVREVFEPLLVFAAGDPDDFTNKDHGFFSGEKFRRSIVAVNDHLFPKRISYRWKLTSDGVETAQGSGSFDVAGGDIVKDPVALTAPNVCRRTSGAFVVTILDENGNSLREERCSVQFFPTRTNKKFARVRAALYDPAGRTAPVLKAAGFPFRPISSRAEMSDCRLLIIGSQALDGTNTFLKSVEAAGLFENGLKILIFEQRPGSLPAFRFTSPSARDAFARRPESPLLKGLTTEDLHDWRGASDALPAFVISAENSPHYPRSKWKCGNGGIVCGHALCKPDYGAFRVIVDCGFNLSYAALMEYRHGHGLAVFCQMDVTARYGKDPAATRLVDNLLSEMSRPFTPVGPRRALYLGDAVGAARLDRLGIGYTKVTTLKPGERINAPIVFLGADPTATARNNDLAKSLAEVPSVVLLPGAPLDWLPGKVHTETQHVFRASAPAAEPIFIGVPDADLYFRTARPLPIYTGLPSWFAAASPAIFGRLQNGTQSVIFLPPASDEMKGPWNAEKCSRVWSSVFTELNVEVGKDIRLFSAETEAAYAVTPDRYDGDAFHNW